MDQRIIPEILLIDKPKGVTSFDVVRRLQRGFKDGTLLHHEKKIVGEQSPKKLRIGHAGTLDPLASGLMIIGVGSGTKQLTALIGLDKEYIAEILIGEKRTTGDMEGVIMEERRVADIFSSEKISATFESMLGTLRLPVSAYSAIKKGGVPMYKRARKAEKEGKIVTDVPIRDMQVREAEFLKQENSTSKHIISEGRSVVQVRFSVGSGTYIRSLAEEFGKRLGYPATLKNLRRTKVGEFDISNAMKLEDFG